MKISTNLLIIGSISLLLSACGDAAKLPDQAGIGPNPTIPPPNTTLIPTINIAAAKGWPEGTQPTPAPDLAVNAYAPPGLITPAGSMSSPMATSWWPKPMVRRGQRTPKA
jgi:hypothetical protein